ncbi:MAG: hypothetical protein IM574_14440 [Cytophagales bacterium]|uniref:hypothetical protein n=1 Tax=Microcystis sp. M176S2 TaxID=2771159 RepID=UPI00258A5D3F|nr:hypothetical protein [Microcystis sp. M176S2]MCA6379232.1 hypothetical protein [Cytophagales bacterium]MCA2721215.1 hypothetical protein [Microcystis sp. M176S2]MCA6387513.1 hypothetical protein [Cytophagales bacterium]MCA6391184.1 hypothetical protein [Cytophagales bacterium]MCA6395822.1 hypothetical protein [Cytophagales bacterium]
MKRLKVVPYKALEKATFYTLQLEGSPTCETDEFISKFINDLLYQKDLSTIVYWLNKMGEEMGTLERYFRPEKGAKAIPITSSRLRLYVIRLSDQMIILGNGGIKTSQKVQDSPDAFPHFDTIVTIEKIIRKRRSEGQITITGRKLSGNLDFDIY